MKLRVTAVMRIIRCCCRCWRAAVSHTHGEKLISSIVLYLFIYYSTQEGHLRAEWFLTHYIFPSDWCYENVWLPLSAQQRFSAIIYSSSTVIFLVQHESSYCHTTFPYNHIKAIVCQAAFCRNTFFWLWFSSAWLRMNMILSHNLKRERYIHY